MAVEIRFGDYTREATANHLKISYNHLTPPVEHDSEGREQPYRAPPIRLRPVDAYRLIAPYLSKRLIEQLKAVVPLALYLMLFQSLILRQTVADSVTITAGLSAVVLGLMLFMEGLRVGLMPFGEAIGTILPTRAHLPVVLLITLLLGIGVTFAEPAIGALKTAGATVDPAQAPYLYLLLDEWAETLVLVVGLGVGAAAVLGTLRLLYGWSLKPLIYLTLVPTGLLAAVIASQPLLAPTLGLAWDCGAVTTGPVTVPLVLSLGIGIAAAAGKGGSSLDGFGIVTLASLFPVLAVEGLVLYVAATTTPQELLDLASQSHQPVVESWYEKTPWGEIIAGVRAIVPLVLFLLLVMRFVLREKLKNRGHITYGIFIAVLGMILFNIGLSYGLSALGSQSGSLVPAAFTAIEAVAGSPLYGFIAGVLLALAFAWMLGFGATLAEPALNALGLTVENLTSGAFRKQTLMMAVSFGVGCGIALGVVKILFAIPLFYLLVPGYLVAVALTFFSSEEFVNVAWDSAGVTTGPVTVPLVLSMGLGFGGAVDAVEGFGILSMASIGPIIAVLSTGLWIDWKVACRHRRSEGG